MLQMYAVIGILGLIIGSFLNVVIHRLPRKMSLWGPRSQCPGCDTQIKAYDNIPVLSFLLLRRRCRNCGCVISWRYPLVELLTALVLTALAMKYGWSIELLKFSLLALLLIPIALIDWDLQIIPNVLSLPGFILGVALTLIFQIETWRFMLWGILIGFALPTFFLVAGKLILKKDSVGHGDVKLLMMTGAYLGFPGVLFGLFGGAFIALFYIGYALIRKQIDIKNPIAFGPFIAISTVVYLFIGPPLIEWYLNP